VIADWCAFNTDAGVGIVAGAGGSNHAGIDEEIYARAGTRLDAFDADADAGDDAGIDAASGERSQELRVSVQDSAAARRIASFLTRLLREIDPGQSRPLVLVSIGSDRLTGDSLGPLVGSRARDLAPGLPIYGTLERPVHAINLVDTIEEIGQAYQDPLVVAVDACLGQARNVGTVSIGRGALYPGTGVHKDLPPVGEVFISGVVNVGGFLEFLVLQNTRLCLVMQIADCIARALVLTCSAWPQQYAAAASSDTGDPGAVTSGAGDPDTASPDIDS
jgi:putative sporulation protein YyaC